MTLRIEDYANGCRRTESAALVGKNGSMDWLCAPRFDSPVSLAALLGTEANGHWQIAPVGSGAPCAALLPPRHGDDSRDRVRDG